MSYFRWLVFGLLLFCADKAFSAAPTTDKALTAEVAQKMLWALTRQVRTLDIQYTFQHIAKGDNKNPGHVWLKLDRIHHFVHAKALRERPAPNPPAAVEWVRNRDKEWLASAMPKDQVKNAWYVSVQKPSPWNQGRLGDGAYIALITLKRTWTPWHIEVLHTSPFFKKVRLRLSGLQKRSPGEYVLTYQMTVPAAHHHKKSVAYICYIFSLDHGMKLHSTRIYEPLPDGKERPIFLITYDHYILSNGVWFPGNYEYKHWEPNGQVDEDDVLKVKSVRINVKFKPGTFIYTPTHGSIIYDQIAGKRYRYGWGGLHHAPSTAPASQHSDKADEK